MHSQNIVVAALALSLSAAAAPASSQTLLDDRCTRAIANEVFGRHPDAERVDAMALRGTPISQFEVIFSGGGHYENSDGSRTPFLFECISSGRTGAAYGVRIRGAGEREDRGVARGMNPAPIAGPTRSTEIRAVAREPQGNQPADELLGAKEAGAEGDGGEDAAAPAVQVPPPPPLPAGVRSGAAPAVQPANDVAGEKSEEPAEVPVDAAPPAAEPPAIIAPLGATAVAAGAAAAQTVEASLAATEAASAPLDCANDADCILPPQPLVERTALPPPLPAGAPAAVQQAVAPLDAALSRIAHDLPQGQIELLRFAAHATTAASMCPNLELNNQAVVGTLSNVVQASSVNMSAREAASRRDATLIAYGVLTGQMLDDANADKDAFCAAAARNAGEAGSWSFIRASAGN